MQLNLFDRSKIKILYFGEFSLPRSISRIGSFPVSFGVGEKIRVALCIIAYILQIIRKSRVVHDMEM